MTINIILVVLIIGFTAVTISALFAMLIMRRREKQLEQSKGIAKTVDELDEALNSAIGEINRLGALIKSEIDEKYNAMLFLYNLVDDKQKELPSISNDVINEVLAKYTEKINEASGNVGASEASGNSGSEAINASDGGEDSGSIVSQDELAGLGLPILTSQKKPRTFTSPKHKKIWEMRESGQNVTDIAKSLNMGKGEVKLILDLIDRS
ncbi:MAG: hypothetical protein FWG87_09495 [Defluviitaleaceae bacterium]|nr:hypothetical protein [Defluviitaleaceae bacterium]